jgi:hypothetical protein
LVEWYAIPTGELQSHITWCFKTSAKCILVTGSLQKYLRGCGV